jgi:hypothetical protein
MARSIAGRNKNWPLAIWRQRRGIHNQPGAAPQVFGQRRSASAEGATHSESHVRGLPRAGTLKRAFSAYSLSDQKPWGDAPGLIESAPLALTATELNPTIRGGATSALEELEDSFKAF